MSEFDVSEPALPDLHQPEGSTPPPPSGGLDPELTDPYTAKELALLQQIARGVAADPLNIAATNIGQHPKTYADFPFPGYTRIVIPREPVGGIFKPTVPVELLPANPNRLGGRISVTGESAFLVLAPVQRVQEGEAGIPPGVGVITVPKDGSWDLRLGNALWCGSISCWVFGGGEEEETPTIAVAEI